jgi:hypothetical protein
MREDLAAEKLDKGEGNFRTLTQFIWGDVEE